jgi:hypothetical protein
MNSSFFSLYGKQEGTKVGDLPQGRHKETKRQRDRETERQSKKIKTNLK